MKEKRSFIMYVDYKAQIDRLSNEQRGDLLTCIFSYQSTGEYSTTDAVIDFAMAGLVAQFKRDGDKWHEETEKRSKAGRLGGLAKASNAKQCLGNVANLADSVSVSVSESVSDISIDASGNTTTLTSEESSTPKPEVEKLEKKAHAQDFEDAFKAYGRKGNKQTAARYWQKLTEADRKAIISKIPLYVASKEERVFQKDFQGWINPTNRMWEDDLVERKPSGTGQSWKENQVKPSYAPAINNTFTCD